MVRKMLAVLSLLALVSIFITYTEGRVSDEEWKGMKRDFNKQYNSPAAKEDANVRTQALQAIKTADHPGLVKLFTTKVIPFELKRKDPLILDLIVNILKQLKDKEAIDQLIESANKTRPPAKVILIRGMTRIKDPDVINSLIEFIGDKKPGVQIAAIDALAPTKSKEALQPVINALDAEEWQVRASAINYLAKLTDAESKETALEALKERKGKETGRLRADISQAINKLSGGSASSSGDDKTVPVFYGLPIYSKHPVFVVDISGSMGWTAKEGGTKIEVLKKELTNVIKKLPSDGSFNIVAFNTGVTEWQTDLVPAKKNLDKALKWIESLQASGGTNIYDALERAFGYKGKRAGRKSGEKIEKTGGKTTAREAMKKINKVKEEREKTAKGTGEYLDIKSKGAFDAIVFLSDGEPSPNTGKYFQSADILKAVKELNQTRKLKIHTISIGMGGEVPPEYKDHGHKGANLALMRRLAKENGGTCVEK